MKLTPLLSVSDAPRSINFYKDILGFEIAEKFELAGRVVWARLSQNSVSIMINERVGRHVRTSAQTYDDAVFYFHVHDAQELHNDLLRKGCPVGPVESQDYGAIEFTMRDPDGYELAFASPGGKS